jgi:ankyrin repeat protein
VPGLRGSAEPQPRAAQQDLDQRDTEGRTPLLRAIEADDVQAVQMLLDAGANPRLPDLAGTTPLDHAKRRGNTRIIELIEAAEPRVR